MTSIAFLISTWLMMPVTAAQLESFVQLAANNPQQALELYPKYVAKFDEQNIDIQAALHLEALLAAMNSRSWPTFVAITESLKAPEIQSVLAGKRFKLLTRIGVAYRYNNQLEQAKLHYQCALDLADSDLELATLKVNLAIVFRLLEQPAMAFQIIDSIDSELLSTPVKAGYSVIRGNILQSLYRFDDALASFELAHQLYIKLNNQQSRVSITRNILGAALASKQPGSYVKYRTTYADEISQYGSESRDYLTWMDTINNSMQKGELSAQDEEFLKQQVTPLTELGYKEALKEHLKRINAIHLYPKKVAARKGEQALPENIGKPWCALL
ncbi:hypothetical protein [Pseudoalteromonas byunsanensis]|uniref:Uncharacterized protein n=1 Tax=Pseudoalteromonas byunsanensis TaxID=327939 RepID=A0A1S1N4C3_9GAMM|nr:hypothetical protein [Pseudoalteromonas byunsanensis]OHU93481.1 hypothetical protein BIW53_19185 [Pseudoalteromonas byunsanensis]